MQNGSTVAAFEREFAAYVGARYGIALCNGTATLHTALVAIGVKPGDRVAVPPLTMSATTIAVLHAGGVPVFVDVDPDTGLMAEPPILDEHGAGPVRWKGVPVSLYGRHCGRLWPGYVDDAAQTLRSHGSAAFTSYSFQASKILALGEGGMLVTNDERLATCAREFSSLGYRMQADQPRIDPAVLKHPNFARHHGLGYNYRMSDLVAAEGLRRLAHADELLLERRTAASSYRDAIAGCAWLTPQHVPEGGAHDYWTYAVAVDTPARWSPFVDAIVRHGGERPYAAWRLTYQEPAFRHLAPDGTCPVAEDLQPRLVQFQTNRFPAAERNAAAVRAAIQELGG